MWLLNIEKISSKVQVALMGGVLSLFLLACGEEIPVGVISPKQMPAVLIDVHLVDGQLASLPIDSARVYRDSYYDAVFKRFSIDSTILRQSIEFYTTRPYLMNDIYTVVEKRLEEMNRAEIQLLDQQYQTKRIADSIRHAHRTDSLRRIMRDSLDLKHRQRLLFPYEQDSTDLVVDAPIYEALRQGLWEATALDIFFKGSPPLASHSTVPTDTIAADEPTPAVPPLDTIPRGRPLLRPEIQR